MEILFVRAGVMYSRPYRVSRRAPDPARYPICGACLGPRNAEWWAMKGSNLRPSRCKRDALPTELIAHGAAAYPKGLEQSRSERPTQNAPTASLIKAKRPGCPSCAQLAARGIYWFTASFKLLPALNFGWLDAGI